MTGAEYKKGGKSRILQLTHLSQDSFPRFMNIVKYSHGKYKVLEIYDEPLGVVDGKHEGNATGHYKIDAPCFCIDDAKIASGPGVYKIENDDSIYIGSTKRSMRKRFVQHYTNLDGNHNKTFDVLHNGGTFTCLQHFEKGTDKSIIRQREQYYIQEYMDIDIGKFILNERNAFN